jgi:hypothetical protein
VLLERWLPDARDVSFARLTQVTQTALGKAFRDERYRGRTTSVV